MDRAWLGKAKNTPLDEAAPLAGGAARPGEHTAGTRPRSPLFPWYSPGLAAAWVGRCVLPAARSRGVLHPARGRRTSPQRVQRTA